MSSLTNFTLAWGDPDLRADKHAPGRFFGGAERLCELEKLGNC